MSESTDLLVVVDDRAASFDEAALLAKHMGCEWVAARSKDELREVLAARAPSLALVAADMKDDAGIAALLTLGSATVRPACVLVGDMDGRILASLRRLGQQYGLTILGTMSRPLSQRAAEQLFAPALRSAPPILADELHAAVNEQQFVLHYQPQATFEGDAMRIRGAEAFVRWNHPRRGLLYPSQFLQPIEQAELSGALADLVITDAVRQAGGWSSAGRELSVTVNLSPRLVRDRDFPGRLGLLLREFEVPPERLIVDVTEEASHTDYERILDVFTRLRMLGVGLTLDNFGTGFSSLTELCRMPYTEVKVDRSLISELPHNSDACVVTEAVAGLAHKLGLRACAAGVESVGALQTLRAYGYDAVQGQAICEPVTAARLNALSADQCIPLASSEVLAVLNAASNVAPPRRAALPGR